MKKWICIVCDYVHEGENAPEICPLCQVSADEFTEQDAGDAAATEHADGVAPVSGDS